MPANEFVNEMFGPMFNPTYELGRRSTRAFDYEMSNDFGEWERNIEIASRCISNDPRDLESYFYRSIAYAKTDKQTLAVADAQKIFEIIRWEDCYKAQGEFYEKKAKQDLALICYDLAYALKNKNDLLVKISRLHLSGGNYLLALLTCERLLDTDTDHFKGHLFRSEAYWHLNKPNDAINSLLTCITLNPYYADSYAKLGRYYHVLNNRCEETICLFRKALRYEPKNPEFFFSLGQYYNLWDQRTTLSLEFIKNLDIDEELQSYISDKAFDDRVNVATGFFGRSFASLFGSLKTEMDELDDVLRVSMFVGNSNYLFDVLKNNTLYFSEVNSFPDKVSDCPLLNPINQSQLAVNISYNNVRVRCFSSLNNADELSRNLSMWDRYANGHRGVCYTLAIPKKWLIKNNIYANKINYTEDAGHLNADMPEQVIKDGLFVKHVGYADEREFRLVHFGKYEHSDGIKFNFYGGRAADESVTIEAVYLGSHIAPEQKTQFIELLSTYSEHVNVFQMSVSKIGQLHYERL